MPRRLSAAESRILRKLRLREKFPRVHGRGLNATDYDDESIEGDYDDPEQDKLDTFHQVVNEGIGMIPLPGISDALQLAHSWATGAVGEENRKLQSGRKKMERQSQIGVQRETLERREQVHGLRDGIYAHNDALKQAAFDRSAAAHARPRQGISLRQKPTVEEAQASFAAKGDRDRGARFEERDAANRADAQTDDAWNEGYQNRFNAAPPPGTQYVYDNPYGAQGQGKPRPRPKRRASAHSLALGKLMRRGMSMAQAHAHLKRR